MKNWKKLPLKRWIGVGSYADKWGRVGRSPGPCNRREVEKCFHEVCKIFTVQPPGRILWIESPARMQEIYAGLSPPAPASQISGVDLIGPTLSQVSDQFGLPTIRGVLDSIWKRIRRFDARTGSPIIHYVWRQTGKWELAEFYRDSHERMFRVLGTLAFADFFFLECGLGDWGRLLPLAKLVKNCGWWSRRQCEVLFFDRPVKIHTRGGRLHRDGGPALQYQDGFKAWCLHGVSVPQNIAETPADRLDIAAALREHQGSVRWAIIQKVGIERVGQNLGAIRDHPICQIADSWKGYELLMLDLGGRRSVPYLKMKNPSTGAYHLEGVHPTCIRDRIRGLNGLNTLQ